MQDVVVQLRLRCSAHTSILGGVVWLYLLGNTTTCVASVLLRKSSLFACFHVGSRPSADTASVTLLVKSSYLVSLIKGCRCLKKKAILDTDVADAIANRFESGEEKPFVWLLYVIHIKFLNSLLWLPGSLTTARPAKLPPVHRRNESQSPEATSAKTLMIYTRAL